MPATQSITLFHSPQTRSTGALALLTTTDVLWGTALTWMAGFGLVEAVAPIETYIDRWNTLPSVARVAQIDADLLKAQGNA
jgi:hypothetical protein